ALQEGGDGAGLDRRGVSVVGGAQGAQQRLGQTEIREGNISHRRKKSLRPPDTSGVGAPSGARLGGLLFVWACSGMKRRSRGASRDREKSSSIRGLAGRRSYAACTHENQAAHLRRFGSLRSGPSSRRVQRAAPRDRVDDVFEAIGDRAD